MNYVEEKTFLVTIASVFIFAVLFGYEELIARQTERWNGCVLSVLVTEMLIKTSHSIGKSNSSPIVFMRNAVIRFLFF